MMTTAAATTRRPARPRTGFTLIEVIAAIVLLSIGLLAIAGLGVAAAKTTRRGTAQTVASAIAQSRFDSLSSVSCSGLAASGATTGSATIRGVQERWRVIDGNDVKRLTDSLTVPGRAGVLVYQSVIPCRD